MSWEQVIRHIERYKETITIDTHRAKYLTNKLIETGLNEYKSVTYHGAADQIKHTRHGWQYGIALTMRFDRAMYSLPNSPISGLTSLAGEMSGLKSVTRIESSYTRINVVTGTHVADPLGSTRYAILTFKNDGTLDENRASTHATRILGSNYPEEIPGDTLTRFVRRQLRTYAREAHEYGIRYLGWLNPTQVRQNAFLNCILSSLMSGYFMPNGIPIKFHIGRREYEVYGSTSYLAINSVGFNPASRYLSLSVREILVGTSVFLSSDVVFPAMFKIRGRMTFDNGHFHHELEIKLAGFDDSHYRPFVLNPATIRDSANSNEAISDQAECERQSKNHLSCMLYRCLPVMLEGYINYHQNRLSNATEAEQQLALSESQFSFHNNWHESDAHSYADERQEQEPSFVISSKL